MPGLGARLGDSYGRALKCWQEHDDDNNDAFFFANIFVFPETSTIYANK